MKSIYYAIWSVVLILPMPLKILAELILLILAAAISWFFLKYLLFAASKLLFILNIVVLGGSRWLIGKLFDKKEQAYLWDERIGHAGQVVAQWLNEKGKNVTKLKFFHLLCKKAVLILLGFVYLAAILPAFKLEKFVSDYYIDNLYSVNRMFGNLEKKATKNKKDYPSFLEIADKEKQKKKKAKKKKKEAAENAIYLVIKEDLQNANLRESPSIEGTELCILSQDDQIIYLNTFESDSERNWLKVTVPTRDNIEGWVSERVIREDIIATLNLQ